MTTAAHGRVTGSAEGLRRTGLWRRLDAPGLERFALWRGRDGWRLEGTLVTVARRRSFEARYAVTCDASWRTRAVVVEVRTAGTTRSLVLETDGRGRWRRDGRVVPRLRGCLDVDLHWSAATNTLAIRRLGLRRGGRAGVVAAWVRLPELKVVPLPQRYVRLAARRFRYESGNGAFAAELDVDDLGLVTSYSGFWERVDAR